MSPVVQIVQSVTADITVKCGGCGMKHNAQPKITDVIHYFNGAKVQDVWPDEDANYREVMIGYRAHWFVCPSCDEANSCEEVTDA